MDIRAGRWGGTNQEYGRAGDPSRSAVAQGERWHAECSWLPFCRKHADGGVDVATTAAPCLGVSHRRLCSSAPWGSGSISAPHEPSAGDRTAALSRSHQVRDRIRGRPTFPMLVETGSCLFKGEKPDLSWIT